jgi:hypothetical protein
MKPYYLIPLLLLSACSTAPKLALRPQQPPSATDISTVRYPEVIRAYHIGRYADPNDDLMMHEQHTVYRVEENTRWDLRSLPTATMGHPAVSATPRDTAFSPTPVNDAILAEVNSQRLATAQIMLQARTLSTALAQFQNTLQQTKAGLQQTAALRTTVGEMKQKLDALESAQGQSQSFSTNNADPLSP